MCLPGATMIRFAGDGSGRAFRTRCVTPRFRFSGPTRGNPAQSPFHPSLEQDGDWDEISTLVRMTLDRGNSARRQLQTFAESGRLEDVIDLILRETVQRL
jgi:hypothetical protein